jgi:hypothetical protein
VIRYPALTQKLPFKLCAAIYDNTLDTYQESPKSDINSSTIEEKSAALEILFAIACFDASLIRIISSLRFFIILDKPIPEVQSDTCNICVSSERNIDNKLICKTNPKEYFKCIVYMLTIFGNCRTEEVNKTGAQANNNCKIGARAGI